MAKRRALSVRRGRRQAWGMVALCAAAGALCLSVLWLAQGMCRARATLSFTYALSARGLAPDGTWLDLAAFSSRENARRAIESLGLDGRLDAVAVASGIDIAPSAGSDGDGRPYFSASYDITLTLPLSHACAVPAWRVLDALCETYRQAFIARHVVTAQGLADALCAAPDAQAAAYAPYLRMLLARAQRFLSMRMALAGAFAAPDGTTFAALLGAAQEMEDRMREGGLDAQAMSDLVERITALDAVYVEKALRGCIAYGDVNGGDDRAGV